MMRTRFFPILLVFVLFLAACAPAASENPPSAAVTGPPSAALATATSAAPASEAATQSSVSQPTALPAATSRGPDLHATDPATVSLASGGLQFVEFFRFT